MDASSGEAEQHWRDAPASETRMRNRSGARPDPPRPRLRTEGRVRLDDADPYHRQLVDQGRALAQLAILVEAGRLPLQDAVARASAPEWPLAVEAACSTALSALSQASADDDMAPRMLGLARLVQEVARCRWGAHPGSGWWFVSDIQLSVALLTLCVAPNGRLYEETCALADDRVLAVNELKRAADGDVESAQMLDEFTVETLYSAAQARIAPYMALVDQPTVPLPEAEHLRACLARRMFAFDGQTEFFGEADSTTSLPDPAGPFEEAARLLEEAEPLATGHIRALVLMSLAQTVTVLGPGGRPGTDPRCRTLAREAFDLIDSARDPVRWVELLHMLLVFDEASKPNSLEELLPVPLGTATSPEGRRQEAELYNAALNAALASGSRGLVRQLIDAAPEGDRAAPDTARRSLLMHAVLHALPQDRMECPFGPFSVVDSYQAMMAQADAENWPDQRRGETLLHLLSHVPAGQGAKDAIQVMSEFAHRRYTVSSPRAVIRASTFLYGTLHERAPKIRTGREKCRTHRALDAGRQLLFRD